MLSGFFSFWKSKGISLAIAWSFNQLAYAIVYPFVPIYLSQERGLPYTQVSLLFPLLGLAVILAPIPCGWLTDRFGNSLMMLAGQLLRGAVFFFLAFCVYIQASFWVFVAALMFNTAVGVAFQVGSDAYLVDISTTDERPGYYSKIRIGYNVGWAVGPMLGAFFSKTPFWVFFLMTGVLCIFGTVHTYFTCCRGRELLSARVREEKSSAASQGVMKDIFCNKRFILLMLGNLFLMLLASQLYSTLSIYSTSVVGISRKALGSIYSLNGTMVLLLQIPLVALLKRIKMPIMMQLIAGTLLYTAGYFQLGFAGGAIAIAIAVAVVTLGEIVVQPALYTATSSETNSGNAGRMMSVSSFMRGIGYSLGPWIGAQLYARTSSVMLWGILSCFTVISAAAFFAAGEKRGVNNDFCQ
ncbi:MAG: MFS transporter [Lentisphaeria bacterium]|nr:MFS transporter [Lentisphaeria bacterium]